jgi:hypothetical protein
MGRPDAYAKLGLAQANVSDYERSVLRLRGSDLIVKWSSALGLSTDELLGVRAAKEGLAPRTARLVKKLQRIAELPPPDQRAVLRFVDALLASRGVNGNGRREPSATPPR